MDQPSNLNQQAHPMVYDRPDTVLFGMTKLELATMHILQGLVSNPFYNQPQVVQNLQKEGLSLEIVALNFAVQMFKTIEVYNNPPPPAAKGSPNDSKEKSSGKKQNRTRGRAKPA